MEYPPWFKYKVGKFTVGDDIGCKRMNTRLLELGIDASSIITIHRTGEETRVVYYKKEV